MGVLSTGDELVEPFQTGNETSPNPLAPGKIRDSNRAMLLAAVAAVGARPVDLGGCVGHMYV